ncbi:MAG: AbrB family transcriptional regulator [Deltaproteobacteria bacterium]|nr:AbrB family transcriptional regulator [Deltaproteobacteria bacterium]
MAAESDYPKGGAARPRRGGGRGAIALFLKWLALGGLSLFLTLALERASLPAARFLGPMLAGISFALLGAGLKLPGPLFLMSKGFLGLRIAASLGPGFLATLGASWPLVAGSAIWAMALAAAVGLAMARRGSVPGTTAIWGLSPGGAAIMTALSGEYGADARLVAFAQYLRVVLVSLAAVLVSRYWAPEGFATAAEDFFPSVAPVSLAGAVGISLLGVLIGDRTRVPAGTVLFPLLGALALKGLGGVDIALPPFLLYPAYAIIGWRIGLNFSKESLRQALRLFPAILSGIALMIGGCGLFGVLMWKAGGVEPLTAYLATSPGGLDVVVIIAAGTSADLPLVATAQTLRLLAVLIWGPPLAKFAASLARPRAPAPPPETGR